jgi:hypothetical protein
MNFLSVIVFINFIYILYLNLFTTSDYIYLLSYIILVRSFSLIVTWISLTLLLNVMYVLVSIFISDGAFSLLTVSQELLCFIFVFNYIILRSGMFLFDHKLLGKESV